MAFLDRFKRKAHPEKKPKAKRPEAKLVDKSAAPVQDKPAAKAEPPKDSTAFRVLVRPLVSEKTSRIEGSRQYVFVVARGANKVEIKKAVERHYRVHVTGVNVATFEGKTIRYGRTEGRRKDWRKAYVTVAKGESIAF